MLLCCSHRGQLILHLKCPLLRKHVIIDSLFTSINIRRLQRRSYLSSVSVAISTSQFKKNNKMHECQTLFWFRTCASKHEINVVSQNCDGNTNFLHNSAMLHLLRLYHSSHLSVKMTFVSIFNQSWRKTTHTVQRNTFKQVCGV